MSLMRWDPFAEMRSLREVMDRLFDESFVQPAAWLERTMPGDLDLDLIETGDALVVKASVPGVKPEDVDITVQNNVLTIQGETREEREAAEGRYHRRERRYGSFRRSVALPVDVNADAADARFEDGVLTITLPKTEQARAKRIPIGGFRREAIEAPPSASAPTS